MDTDIAQAKAALRIEAKARRAALTERARRMAGVVASEILFSDKGLNLFSRFRGFTSYLHVDDELPTDDIHFHLFGAQAVVIVPRWSRSAGRYAWAALLPGDVLRQGPMRIPEPSQPGVVPPSLIDVALVPGLCFDVLGGRLGHGAGVYDRLLRQLRPGTLRIGLGFACQLWRDPLPQEPHDLRMDYVVTEEQWIDCRRARRTRRDRHA